MPSIRARSNRLCLWRLLDAFLLLPRCRPRWGRWFITSTVALCQVPGKGNKKCFGLCISLMCVLCIGSSWFWGLENSGNIQKKSGWSPVRKKKKKEITLKSNLAFYQESGHFYNTLLPRAHSVVHQMICIGRDAGLLICSHPFLFPNISTLELGSHLLCVIRLLIQEAC